MSRSTVRDSSVWACMNAVPRSNPSVDMATAQPSSIRPTTRVSGIRTSS